MGIGGIAIYIVGLIALFYFFAIRPQKKKEKELMNIQNAIQVGDWVMTSSGFYGRVADIADQVFVVEFGTNKGVKIPVRKSEIIGNKEPNLTVSPSSSDEKDK
ncbi:MAG: preprotein translocase subunit YajC [Clostridiales bacterium]|nr:preprotein translocase subunit YajC [Clostridiales bacterium]